MNYTIRSLSCLFFLSVFACVTLYSQNLSIENRVKPAIGDYFGMPRPLVFLHTNKSDYVQGEYLWFNGYIYDPLTGSPYNERLNLYVGVYDSEGNQIKKELFISENGISKGQIKVDSIFSAGLYYLKATTGILQNLKEEDSFIQKFRVINRLQTVLENSKDILDINFLPEGGTLVSDVPATVGVKVENRSGQGVEKFKGYLVESKGDTVASFETNMFGLARFNFLPRKEGTYSTSLIDSEGRMRQFFLPEIEERGIGINVKRLSENKIQITLGMNPLTRSEIGEKTYSLLFHRDGLLKHMDINFPKDETFVSYIFNSEELHPGMNIVTLVDNTGIPVVERLVFNSGDSKKNNDLNISVKSKKFDSVQLTLFAKNSSKSLKFLSASILPLGTKAYQKKKNISSSFLLESYVNENIEHPSYYFTETSKKRENDLDLLLLTQGWSRYDWKNIFNNSPRKENNSRTGVDLYGKLNFELGRNENLLLYIGDKPYPKRIELSQDLEEFVLKNYYFENGDELQFTTINSNGKLSRPNLYVRLDNGIRVDKIHSVEKYITEIVAKDNSEAYNLEDFIMPDKTIVLNEATVVDKKKRNHYLISPVVNENRVTEITERERKMYPRFMDIIRSNGFRVIIDWTSSYEGRVSIVNLRNGLSPALYVDDIFQVDFNNIEHILTDEIGAYFIDKSGNAEPGAGGGVIRLYRKIWGEGEDVKVEKESRFFLHNVKNGFTPVKDFHVPNYASVTDDAFINFGTIHWEPGIILDENGKADFIFDGKGWTEFELFIEGMASDGSLFSTNKIIRVDSSQ